MLRSRSVMMMLAFAGVGTLWGCDGGSAKGIGSGGDAGGDGQAGERDAVVLPASDAISAADRLGADGLADASPAADAATAPDRGRTEADGGQDGIGDDARAVEPADAGARTDLDLRRDSGPDTEARTDAALPADLSPDLVAGADSLPEGGAVDTAPVADAGKLDAARNDTGKTPDARADGGAKEAGPDGNLTPFCQGILLDNGGRPDNYPVTYAEPADAAEVYENRKAQLVASYGIGASDYTFTPTPVAWATTLDLGAGTCSLVIGGPVSASTMAATARAFLGKWASLFQYADMAKPTRDPYCFSNFCKAEFDQDYCGLAVASTTNDYRGYVSILVYAQNGCLDGAASSFVPTVPIPRNVLVTSDALRQAVVGQTLTAACPGGQMVVQVAADDAITVADTPKVFVRKSPTSANALEYRLAVPVTVEAQIGMSWTVYVDGIDGTVIESAADFICG